MSIRTRLERGHNELEEVNRGRVAGDHLIGRGADQLRDLGADALWGAEPALAPAADEPLAPLVIDGRVQPRRSAPGQPPERVAVQVDQVGVVDHELVAKVRQLVLAVQLARVGRVGAEGHRRSL